MDDEHCYRAMSSKDARFDGWFYVAVTSTGIYCRPSCPAVTPRRENTRFFPTSAAAQAAGFRACKRCRPDAAPGSPEWNVRADVVGRAMRLIADGAVDRDGVSGLAAALGYSERQLNRLLVAEVGVGPLALARARRAQTARVLLETTGLPISEVAFGAGFASIRQFNDTVRRVFAHSPTELRRRAGRHRAAGPTGVITLRLPYRPPIDLDLLFGYLAARAVPGVEEYTGGRYRRVLALPHCTGIVELSGGDGYVWCTLRLDDLRDLGAAVERSRQLLDLDADPVAVDARLAGCAALAPLVAAAPGRRVPGAVDPAEIAVRAVLGQQVSVAGARTVAGRLTARYGKPLTAPTGSLTHAFPTAAALAEADPDDLPMPAARRRALLALTDALASGAVDLGPGADRDESEARLTELPGIGPWTAGYIRMRALGDPDVFLPTDLGIRRGLERLGRDGAPAAATALAESWRPWRSYAMQHVWAVPQPDGRAAASRVPAMRS
ncbi:AlkA N-terminal domain-containing protein [Marinitenerispora sediminis]|uniref:DNA-3-methyladenine glycosylase II n=1 Tax=Marinitenerispora sediminis TaxID=1931232 RepID=A0A368T943_9ACTN|nr:AlkA N-terminal domain-containing protein [Marinitenerispora sediminis]RCV55445.1 AraC family transcriptional regulator [Marinitenerispora sediminis]RCV60791.1 AraC family transcriptional regulator [Marinitenerispora sediminis]RCV61742.1 AraC family transcriptional regulator [Marinitenerispora sediminis]